MGPRARSQSSTALWQLRSVWVSGLGGWVIYNKSLPMAPLSCTVEADERVGARGEVVRALDEASLRTTLRRLKAKNITAVVFDRNGYRYHGKVKAIADGARKAGISL